MVYKYDIQVNNGTVKTHDMVYIDEIIPPSPEGRVVMGSTCSS